MQPIVEEFKAIDNSAHKLGPSGHFSKLAFISDKNGTKKSLTEKFGTDKRELPETHKKSINILITSNQTEEKFKLGVEDFSALEKKRDDKMTPSLRKSNFTHLYR